MATKQDLTNEILSKDGMTFSDGTLNPLHLITHAYDVLTAYGMMTDELERDILSVLEFDADLSDSEITNNVESKGLYYMQYHGLVVVKEDLESEESASNLWTDTLFDLLDTVSPDGFYFGNLEGDGACIGWFRYEEETEEDQDEDQ